MRAYIGSTRDVVTVYHLSDALVYLGVSPAVCDRVGDWLSKHQWLVVALAKLTKHYNEKQRVLVELDDYDTWNADETLAHVILPVLKQLQRTKTRFLHVDESDLPTGLGLRTGENNQVTPQQQWTWVIQQMIWSFEQLLNSDQALQRFFDQNHCCVDQAAFDEYLLQQQRGFELFGKYYTELWS